MAVFLKIKKEDMRILIDNGLGLDKTKTKYEVQRLKGAVVAVLFTSGRLLIQGNDDTVDIYRELLLAHGFKERVKIEFVKQEGLFIGSDDILRNSSKSLL